MLLGQFRLFTPSEAAHALDNPDDAECQIEHTGRLVLPENLLKRLTACQPPFLFRLGGGSGSGGGWLHLGYPVFRSFRSPGAVLVPSWAAAQLNAISSSSGSSSDRSTVPLSVESLPSGAFIRLRPLQPVEVCRWANPTATLNKKLRDFACLSVGAVFSIHYLDRTFYFEVKSLKPSHAVSVIDCDMQLEFDFDSDGGGGGGGGGGGPGADTDAAAAAAAATTDVVLSSERLRRCGVNTAVASTASSSTSSTSAASFAASPTQPDGLLRDALVRARAASDAAARRWGSGVALATGEAVPAAAAAAAPSEASAVAEPNLDYEWGSLTFRRPAGRVPPSEQQRPSAASAAEAAADGKGGGGVRLKDSLR